MPTTAITAQCNARPSRLAFVLPTPDRETSFAVIARATSLWGYLQSDHHPRRKHSIVHGIQEERSSGGDYLRSQEVALEAFDPDIRRGFPLRTPCGRSRQFVSMQRGSFRPSLRP